MASNSAKNAHPPIGSNIGKFTLIAQIKQRSESDLYQATDQSNQSVFLELMHNEGNGAHADHDSLRLDKLLTTIQNNTSLILETGKTKKQQPYVALPFQPGALLSEQLAHSNENLSETDALNLLRKIATALGTLHESTVIHQDLRPETIWITEDDTLPVLLGLAHAVPNLAIDKEADTVSFASPEQLGGESATIHSNIYTMGVMLYTLLAGHAPHYSAAEWDIFDQQNSRQMIPLSDVRPDLKSDTLQIVRHCMWGQAWRRYDNTAELIAAIDAALAATKAAPLIESEEKRSVLATVLDNRVVLYAGIAIVLLIMALMIGFIFRDSGETAVSTTQSNLTAVPNSAIAAEATETAVLTNTPASANAPIQISMIRPEPEEMYALSDMLAFAWEWPEPLAAGQRFIISIYQEDELKARTAIFTPIANTRYEWEIPITDFAESPGEYQWEMGLELEGIDRNIREVSLTAFTILENTPTPTITNTPSPTATPTNTPTPTNTATPTATATRACVRIRPSGWISYAIQDNDSLSFLATQTGTTVARLQEVNCLSTIALTVGQTLYLPTSPFPSTPTAEPLSTPSDNEPPSNPNPQPTSPPPPPTASGPPTPTAPAIP